ncbi:hypothetical protein [Spiroplasma endosymbiont of Colias croceus]|uniref:hypothetical protein n=1 Tax=Spiroplasma endosymbiont of Colias croceus TaxID=3066310 RepID=UPI0030D21876
MIIFLTDSLPDNEIKEPFPKNELYFITTIKNIDNSINEEVIHFQQLIKGNIKVFKQTKQYQNINEYSKDIILIEESSNHNTNNSHFVQIKDFLKLQHECKLKPTKTDWKIWGIIFGITLLLLVVAPICTFVIPALIPVTATALLLETKIIIAISLAFSGLIFKGISSIFENSTKKFHSWMKQKFHLWIRKIPFVNKRNFGKTKEEIEIKNNIKKTTENLNLVNITHFLINSLKFQYLFDYYQFYHLLTFHIFQKFD